MIDIQLAVFIDHFGFVNSLPLQVDSESALAERLLLTHGALPDEGLSWQSFL